MSIRDNRFRLQQWQLAERQRYLDELESLAARLRGDAERLHGEIERAAGASSSADRTPVYQLFIRPLVERRDKLTRSLSTIDTQIAETREAVAAARQEVKIYGEAMVPRLAEGVHRRRRLRRA